MHWASAARAGSIAMKTGRRRRRGAVSARPCFVDRRNSAFGSGYWMLHTNAGRPTFLTPP